MSVLFSSLFLFSLFRFLVFSVYLLVCLPAFISAAVYVLYLLILLLILFTSFAVVFNMFNMSVTGLHQACRIFIYPDIGTAIFYKPHTSAVLKPPKNGAL